MPILVERTGKLTGPSDKMLQRTDAEGKWDARKSRLQVTGDRLQSKPARTCAPALACGCRSHSCF